MEPKVLVVEDESAIRAVLTRQLQAKGYEVVAVGSGEEALDVVESKRPDVILLDLTLPGMDGYEMLRRLQGISRGTEIPVVILSGHTLPDEILQGYSSGAVYYVPKPYNLDELLRGLRIACSG